MLYFDKLGLATQHITLSHNTVINWEMCLQKILQLYIFFISFMFSKHMALRGAVTCLLSNSQKCAAVTVSRAQGTAAAAPQGTF